MKLAANNIFGTKFHFTEPEIYGKNYYFCLNKIQFITNFSFYAKSAFVGHLQQKRGVEKG